MKNEELRMKNVSGAWCLVLWNPYLRRTKNQEPRTKHEKPRTKHEKPRTKNQELRTRNQESVFLHSSFFILNSSFPIFSPSCRDPGQSERRLTAGDWGGFEPSLECAEFPHSLPETTFHTRHQSGCGLLRGGLCFARGQ